MLSLLKTIFFPFIKQICLRTSQVNNLEKKDLYLVLYLCNKKNKVKFSFEDLVERLKNFPKQSNNLAQKMELEGPNFV